MDAPLPTIRSLWDYNDPATSETRFQEWLIPARKSNDLDRELQLLTQIARTHSLRMQIDEAHAILDEVKPRLTTSTFAAQTRYLLERGRTYNSDGNPEKALPLFIEAWELASPSEDDLVIELAFDAAHMVGFVASPDVGLEWSHRAIDLAEASSSEGARRWLGTLYNNTGWTYHDRGEYEKALELLEKGLVFRQQSDDPQSIRIAHWSIARCYRSMDRLDEALDIQNELVRSPEASGYVYEELGELMLGRGRPNEAQTHFAKAHSMLITDPWLKKHEAERLNRLAELGGLTPNS